MYFDLNREKSLTLAGLAASFAALIILFIAANQVSNFVNLSNEALARGISNAAYFLRFKLPYSPSAFSAIFSNANADHSSGAARGVLVLLYHGEGEGPASDMSTSIFVDQLRTLKNAGWQTITTQEFEEYMKGKISLPEKSFLLTFDDGRRDTFYAADPVLKDLGYTAVMFVITGFSLPDETDQPLRNFYLSRSELSYMQKSGRWELESHGDQDHWLYDIAAATSTAGHIDTTPGGHFMSNLFWLSDEERIETPDDFTKRITHDLTLSKQILDRDFAISADLYAFPFNDYGQDTVNFSGARSIVANAASQIYAYGFIQMDPDRNDFFNYPDPNTFFIKRLEPPADWSGKTLLSVVESGSPRTLPYSASSFGPEWQGNWGNVEPRGKTLFLSASPTETGAAATLAGTQWWSDYTITATATVSEGEFSILGRSNGTEAIACTVTGKDLVLEEKKNGLISTLGRADYSLPTSAIRITLALKGSAASCTVGGVSVYGTTSIVRSGDAGFQVWNREKNVAHAEISNVHIDAP